MSRLCPKYAPLKISNYPAPKDIASLYSLDLYNITSLLLACPYIGLYFLSLSHCSYIRVNMAFVTAHPTECIHINLIYGASMKQRAVTRTASVYM